jgi:phosphoglycerate dehydrogenase-like enzyme
VLRVLYDPAPRTSAEIFSDSAWNEFNKSFQITTVDTDRRDAEYEQHLPVTDILISQQPMPRARLDQAADLRAIFNVETNFLPNIDYPLCFERGIHVLTPSSVFATAVAEIGLGMALSLARDIHSSHADFVAGQERYGLDGNTRAELLTGSDVGLIGYGDLGRSLHQLLVPFQARIRAHDPWLPDAFLRRYSLEPGSIETVLKKSRVIFVLAAVTTENQQLLNAETLSWMQDGAMLILLSRAALADFDALAAEARSGRLRIATDVFPQEPVATDDPLRKVPNILFSAHRAGALKTVLQKIGDYVLEDLQQIAAGLPPVTCRRAQAETVMRMRSMPIKKS